MLDAFDQFLSIPDSPQAEAATFYDVGLDNLPPRMFLPDGNPYTPPGPIRLQEIARKRRVRFVKIELYTYVQDPSGAMLVKPHATVYGWQGDNGLLHLYQHPSRMEDLPAPVDLEHSETYARLMRALGHVDWFIDL